MTDLDTTPAPTRADVRYSLRVTTRRALGEVSNVLSDVMRDLDDEAWEASRDDWQIAHKALGDAAEAMRRMARRLEP